MFSLMRFDCPEATSVLSTNINHEGLHWTANEYAEERRICKDLISKNKNVAQQAGRANEQTGLRCNGQIRSPHSLSTDCGDREFQAAEQQRAEHDLRGPET